MADVLDMNDAELEAELLRQLECMSDSGDEDGGGGVPMSPLIQSKPIIPDDAENVPPSSSWNLLMSSVDLNSSQLKTFERNIGEATALTVPGQAIATKSEMVPVPLLISNNDLDASDENFLEAPANSTFLTAVQHLAEAEPPGVDPHRIVDVRSPRLNLSPSIVQSMVNKLVSKHDIEALAAEAVEEMEPLDQEYFRQQRQEEITSAERIELRDQSRHREMKQQEAERERLQAEHGVRSKEIEDDSTMRLSGLANERHRLEKERALRESARIALQEEEARVVQHLKEKLEEEARLHELMVLQEAQQDAEEREERMRTLHLLWKKEEHAAIKLQAIVRARFAIQCTRRKRRVLNAAVTIQTSTRRLQARNHSDKLRLERQYQSESTSAITIQCFARKTAARKKLLGQRRYHAALLIQTMIRRHSAVAIVETLRCIRRSEGRVAAIVKIQNVVRLYLAKNALNHRRCQKIKSISAIVIQCMARLWASRKKHAQLLSKLVKHRCDAAVYIQRVTRGFLSRLYTKRVEFERQALHYGPLPTLQVERNARSNQTNQLLHSFFANSELHAYTNVIWERPSYLFPNGYNYEGVEQKAQTNLVRFSSWEPPVLNHSDEGEKNVSMVEAQSDFCFKPIPAAAVIPSSHLQFVVEEKRKEAGIQRNKILMHAAHLRDLKQLPKDAVDQTVLLAVVEELKEMKSVYEHLLESIEVTAERLVSFGNIETVEMSISALNIVPLTELIQYPNLRQLRIANIKLGSLIGFGVHANLEFLDISGNELVDLKAIKTCQSLQMLTADDNRVESLRSMVETTGEQKTKSKFPRLRALSMNANRLRSLDILEGCMPCLEFLHLYRNEITYLPTSIFKQWKWLRRIDFGRNMLNVIPDELFSHCKLLQSLVLYENKLEQMPRGLNNMLMRELWLNGNRLGSIGVSSGEDKRWMPMLESLYAHDNNITKLNKFTGAPFLRTADLSFNRIAALDEVKEFAEECPRLEILRLNDNPVEEVLNYRAKVISMFTSLKELDGDPVTCEERMRASVASVAENGEMVRAWNRCDQLTDGLVLYGALHKAVHKNSVRERDKQWVWHGFHALCLRQRGEYVAMLREHARALEASSHTTVKSAKATTMRLRFEQDEEARCMAQRHLLEHENFCWRPTNASQTIVFSCSPITKAESLKCDLDGNSLSPIPSNAIETRGSRARPPTAATLAAIKFQALYRGYRSRVKPCFCGSESVVSFDTDAHITSGSIEEFEEINVDEFLNLDFENDVEGDEFVHMERLMYGEAWGGRQNLIEMFGTSQIDAGVANDGVVSTEGFGTDNSKAHPQSLEFRKFAVGDYREAISFEAVQVPGSATSSMQVSPQCSHGSLRPDIVVQNAPYSADNQQRFLTRTPDSPSAVSEYSTTSQPTTSREMMLQKEVHTVAEEWGFSNEQVAQAMLMRRSRFNHAKNAHERAKKMQNPDFKYKQLMRRVKANRVANMAKDTDSVKADTRRGERKPRKTVRPQGKATVSQVGKDRANLRRQRHLRRPTWAAPPRSQPPAMKVNTWTMKGKPGGEEVSVQNEGGNPRKNIFPPLA